jgi:hypothetical protein
MHLSGVSGGASDDRITRATLGLSIAEGKAVLAAIQARIVVD